VALPQTAI